MPLTEEQQLPVYVEAIIFFFIAITFLSIADYFNPKEEKEKEGEGKEGEVFTCNKIKES